MRTTTWALTTVMEISSKDPVHSPNPSGLGILQITSKTLRALFGQKKGAKVHGGGKNES